MFKPANPKYFELVDLQRHFPGDVQAIQDLNSSSCIHPVVLDAAVSLNDAVVTFEIAQGLSFKIAVLMVSRRKQGLAKDGKN